MASSSCSFSSYDSKTNLQETSEIEGKLTWSLLFAVFAIVTGSSFQFGYHVGCMNPPAKLIIDWMVTSCGMDQTTATTYFTFAVSAFCVGGILGGIASSFLADKFGRKLALLLNNVPIAIGLTMMMFARYWNMPALLIVGRVFIGINAGVCSGVTPMYILELSPRHLRGTLSSLHQLAITSSIMVAMIVGLPQLLGQSDKWEYIFGLSFVFATLQLITLPLSPESPKYTLFRGKEEETRTILEKIRGTGSVENEIESMESEAQASEGSLSTWQVMFDGHYRWPLLVSIVLMATQQFSGINAAMFYSTASFVDMGLKEEGAAYATVGMGAVNVLMTLVSTWLVDHPRFGRRSLLLIGLCGMLFAAGSIVVCLNLKFILGPISSYIACGMVFLFVISFATGPGSIPWFFVAEVFPSNARAAASAIAAVVNWSCNFAVGASFLQVMNVLGNFTFMPFCVCLFASIAFVYIFLPETKGLSVEEAEIQLDERRPKCC